MTTPARRLRRRPVAALLGMLAVLLVPALASAHPLGNFTINHYAGIRVESDRILLDVVIDQAEIPTFQARLTIDTDDDGEVTDAEADAGRLAFCESLRSDLELTVEGKAQTLELDEAGLTFPPGAGGLSTMRVVCGFSARPERSHASGARITYADRSFADRLGWREVVAQGSGMTLTAGNGDGALRTVGVSDRLTTYPASLLAQSLQDVGTSIVAMPGGPTAAPFDLADAWPLPGAGDTTGAKDATAAPIAAVAAVESVASVPGGVGVGDLPAIFRSTDLSPLVLLVSILTAGALGAGHALTPGHGKTLMAAYLVGTRGTPVHAAGLGLSVTVSHTLGILVLAALVVGAEGFLPPDVIVRSAPVIAAVSILAIGGWMLFGEGRRRWRLRAPADDHGHGHAHEHDHDHDHDHAVASANPGEHRHGMVTHSHLPPAGATISWRSLFVLGLAGGLIPSTSALLILLGSIAAGRPAFGFVLVVAFGLGMALVMGGIGLALVLARGRLDRVDAGSRLGRATGLVPLVAACLVFGLGIYLTIGAVAGTPTL